jgi:hypothetical protein
VQVFACDCLFRCEALCSAVAGHLEPALLDAVDRRTPDLDELIGAGLVSDANGVRFRHEIVRLAVDRQMPVLRNAALHGMLLAVPQRWEMRTPPFSLITPKVPATAKRCSGTQRLPGIAPRRWGPGPGDREAATHYATALRSDDGAAARPLEGGGCPASRPARPVRRSEG